MSDQSGQKVLATGNGSDNSRLMYCANDGSNYDVEHMADVIKAVRYLAWDDRGLIIRGLKELCEAMEKLDP